MPEAQFALAGMLAVDDGVPQNREEAANWYEEAAKDGHDSTAEALRKLREPHAN